MGVHYAQVNTVSVQLINLELKLKNITVVHLLVFQVSPPIVGSNFARNLSPKSTAGSVLSESSAPGSSTSGLLVSYIFIVHVKVELPFASDSP